MDHATPFRASQAALGCSVGTDRERFELSIPRKRYAGFRDRCLQPLGHLSNRAGKASQGENRGQRAATALLAPASAERGGCRDGANVLRLAREFHVGGNRAALTSLQDQTNAATLRFRHEIRLGAIERPHVRTDDAHCRMGDRTRRRAWRGGRRRSAHEPRGSRMPTSVAP